MSEQFPPGPPPTTPPGGMPSGPPPATPPTMAAPSGQPPTTPPTAPPAAPPTMVPPTGPPAGPPAAPPQSMAPAEYLDSSGGSGWGPPPPAPPTGGGKGRKKWIAGGVAGALVLGVGGYFGYQLVFATGPQPAEALPDSTVAYLSFDLDPSGKQKYEALKVLEKFPGFTDETGLDRDSDLREELFNQIQEGGACPDLDWDDDIEPWLGDRFGFAAVDLGDDNLHDYPVTPVGVVQVKDDGAAEEGMEAIRDCGTGSENSDFGGWNIRDGWMIVAETEDLADQVSEDAESNPLNKDDDYKLWTDAVGDVGIVNGYAAPEAGELFAGAYSEFGDSFGNPACALMGSSDYATSVDPDDDPFGSEEGSDSDDPYGYEDPYDDVDPYDDCDDTSGMAAQQEAITDIFKDFNGAAFALRFADEGLEFEMASDASISGYSEFFSTDKGDDVVGSLPDDTALAMGFGFKSGWVDAYLDYMREFNPMAGEIDELIDMAEDASGLVIPEDIETLAGESAAIALGPDFDPIALEESDDPAHLPLAIKVKGDADAIDGIVQRLLDNPEVDEEFKDYFSTKVDGDYIVGGFNEDWLDQVLSGGDLKDTDEYKDVIKESDKAAGVFFINFNADWIDRVTEDETQIAEMLEPLKAAGMSVWNEDDIAHGVFKLTTD